MSCVTLFLSDNALSYFCRGQTPIKNTTQILVQNKLQGALYLLFQWPSQDALPNVSIQNDSIVTFSMVTNGKISNLNPQETVLHISLQTPVLLNPPPTVSFAHIQKPELVITTTVAPTFSTLLIDDPAVSTAMFPNTFDATSFGCGWYFIDGKPTPGPPLNNFFFKIQNVNSDTPTITFQPGSDVGDGPRNFYLPWNMLQTTAITLNLSAITLQKYPTIRYFEFDETEFTEMTLGLIDSRGTVYSSSHFKIEIVPQSESQGKYKYKLFDFNIKSSSTTGFFLKYSTAYQFFKYAITFDYNGIANGILVNNVYEPC